MSALSKHASNECAVDLIRAVEYAPQTVDAPSRRPWNGRGASQLALLEALAMKADGIILLAHAGAISFANDCARRILADGDGLSWTANGFLTRRGPETRRLRRIIAEAIASAIKSSPVRSDAEMLITRPSGRWPYVVRVLPSSIREAAFSAMDFACIIHLRDLAEVRTPSRSLLVAIFGLTAREADLAVELVRCASLAQAAELSRMAINTARNHLHDVFRKCGVHSQGELLQLLSRL